MSLIHWNTASPSSLSNVTSVARASRPLPLSTYALPAIAVHCSRNHGSSFNAQPCGAAPAVDDLLRRRRHLVERGRRLSRGRGRPAVNRRLVVVEDRVRHVERHRPQRVLDREVVDDAREVVGQVVVVGVDACLRGHDGLRCRSSAASLCPRAARGRQSPVAERGAERGQRVAVARLVDELDPHVVLRRVERVGELGDAAARSPRGIECQ